MTIWRRRASMILDMLNTEAHDESERRFWYDCQMRLRMYRVLIRKRKMASRCGKDFLQHEECL